MIKHRKPIKQPVKRPTKSLALKPGDSVYRVIDHPDGGWYVASVKVKSASDRQVALERPFPFKFRVRLHPTALGHSIFLTPEGALNRFIEESEDAISAANGKIIEASKALAWARASLQHMEELDEKA